MICPHCGGSVRLVAAGGDRRQPAAALAWPEDDGIPRGRPEKVYRGDGAERESTWGAVFPVDVARGDAVRIHARTTNRVWLGKAAADGRAGEAVELVGAKWKPDRDPDAEQIPDPAWVHDTSGDLFRGRASA